MAITLVGSAVAEVSNVPVTVTVPAGVTPDHLCVAVCGTEVPGSQVPAYSGTWVTRVANPPGQGNSEWSVQTRRGLTAGDTFTASITRVAHIVFVWVDTTGQDVVVVGSAATRGGTSSASTTVPGLTTTANNQQVLVIASERTLAAGGITGWSPSAPTQLFFREGLGAVSHYVGTFDQPTAGATGNRTATYSTLSGNAAAVMLAVAAPVITRSGTGSPRALPLARTSRGRKVVRRSGSRSLPLTRGVGVGARYVPPAPSSGGSGVSSPLPFPLHEWETPRVTGTGLPRQLPLATLGTGRKVAQGVGSYDLPLSFGPAAGYAEVFTFAGSGEPFHLELKQRPSHPSAPGRRFEFVFLSPVEYVRHRMAGRGLYSSLPYGLTVWRRNGVWEQELTPSPRRTDGADRLYPGGYLHPLSDDARAELIAGGFADHVTLQEMR